MDGRAVGAGAGRALDTVLDECVDLDPDRPTRDVGAGRMGGRCGSSRSPAHHTARTSSPKRNTSSPGRSTPNSTRPHRRPRANAVGLDVLQADAAAAVAGDGSAGGGRRPGRRRQDHDARPPPSTTSPPRAGRCSVSRRPRRPPVSSKRETGMASDTVAKLLHEWRRTDRPPPTVPARRRHDGDRRRGRHDRHRDLPPAHPLGRRAGLAAGVGR